MSKGYFEKYPKLFAKLNEDDAIIFRIFLEEVKNVDSWNLVTLRDTIVNILHTIYPDVQSVKNELGVVDYEKISLRLINETCSPYDNRDGSTVMYFSGMRRFQSLQSYREHIDYIRERDEVSKHHTVSVFEAVGLETHEEYLNEINRKYYPKYIDHLSERSYRIIGEKTITCKLYQADEVETKLKNIIGISRNQNQNDIKSAFLKLNPKERDAKSKKKKGDDKPVLLSEDIVFCHVDRIKREISWAKFYSDVVPNLNACNITNLPTSTKSTLSSKSFDKNLSIILQWLLAISSRGCSIEEGFDILVYSSEGDDRHTDKDLGFSIIAIQGRTHPRMIHGAYVCIDTSRYRRLNKPEDFIEEFDSELNAMISNAVVENNSDIGLAKLKNKSSLIDNYTAISTIENVVGQISARGEKKSDDESNKITIANEIYAKLLLYNLNLNVK